MPRSRSDRFRYLSDPRVSPPNDDCPECTEPSKTYYMGGKTEGGVGYHTWVCEHDHRWTVTEVRPEPKF